MERREIEWRRGLTSEEIESWRRGIQELNDFLEQKKNRDSLVQLFTSTMLDSLPTTFHDFQNSLRFYLNDEPMEVLMNAVVNHDLDIVTKLGGSDDTLETIGQLARVFSSRLRRGYLSWNILPLKDWFRINTEVVVRGWRKAYLSHSILRNDGELFEFKSDISSSFTLVEHMLRHIEGAITTLGDEVILGDIQSDRLETLAEKMQSIMDIKKELDEKISQMAGTKTTDEDEED